MEICDVKSPGCNGLAELTLRLENVEPSETHQICWECFKNEETATARNKGREILVIVPREAMGLTDPNYG